MPLLKAGGQKAMSGIGLTTQRIKLSSTKLHQSSMHELIKIKYEAIGSRVARSTLPPKGY